MGRAHTHFVDLLNIHTSMECVWNAYEPRP